MTQQNVTLSAKGLYTFPNKLGSVPDGALLEANNVVIDRDGVINPRRGYTFYGNVLGNSSNRSKQLIVYQDRILRHWSTTIDADSDGAGNFVTLNDQTGGVANVLEPTLGTRIKYIEAQGNLYFTSSVGIRKISALNAGKLSTSVITPAGGVQALDGEAVLNSITGWFTQDSTVAYRVVWGIKDANSNVILGAPSERMIIANSLLTLMIKDYNTLVADLATVAAVAPLSLSGTLHSNTSITSVDTTNLSVGMTVADTTTPSHIPANTIITVINTPGVTGTITISNAATASSTDTLSFGQKLHDTDYASLKLSLGATSTDLYQALISLANGTSNKLDTDIGDEAAQVSSITALSGQTGAVWNYASGVSVADYFDVYSAGNETHYRVWFQTGTNISPNLPTTVTLADGSTSSSQLIQVTIQAADSDVTVAANISTSLNNTLDFTCTTGGTNTIVVTNSQVGLSNNITSFVANTGFTVSTTTQGITPVFASIVPAFTSAPDNPATTGELTNLQSYFDAIVNALNSIPQISTYAKQTIGGSFSSSTQSATTNIIFTIPENITTAYFYQIYRSSLFTSGTDTTLSDITPDDELRLIAENNPTAADLSNGFINYYDNIPDSFRVGGANLYTNANSGQGIDQANTPPPLAQDIALFQNYTFYANTQNLYNVQLSLLTALGLAGGTFTITQGSTNNMYTFVDSVAQITNVTCVAGNLYTSSGTADYFDIYSASNVTIYRVWFSVGTAVAPSGTGVTLLKCTVITGDTNAQVANKLGVVLNSVEDFLTSVASNVVTVVNQDTGPTHSPINHVANGGFSLSVTTSGTGENAALLQIGVSDLPTPAQEVDATARSIVKVINRNPDESIYAYYVSGTTDLPGLILFQARNLGDANFTLTTNNNTVSQAFSPSLGTVAAITNISVAAAAVVTSTAHGLTTGQSITISGSNSTPSIDGNNIVTVLTSDTFSVPVTTTISGNSGGWILSSLAQTGSNEIVTNRLFYSKFQQPEAVPIVNFQDIGPKNKQILRIIALRYSLFILSEAGVFVLSGTDPTNFQIQVFDNSCIIKAPDSAAVLNNQIYLFSNQGISTVSDTGVSVISRPIESNLTPLLTPPYTAFVSSTFAVAYESDRAYILYTVQNPTDTVATVAYRWNTFTDTWTSWDQSKTCGTINVSQDIMYIGAADTNSIEIERKTFTIDDQADRQQTLTLGTNGMNGPVMSLGSLFGTTVGDAYEQVQYLTISQLNRLLLQLDNDNALHTKNYYSLYIASAGMNLRNSLSTLASALDSDAGLATHTYVSSISGFGTDFVSTQEAFNTITNLLNNDANTRIKNYITSSGTVIYEAQVVSVNTGTNLITLNYSVPFIAGPVIQYVSIDSSVIWAPHGFGDVSMLKHISESTVLFDTVSFSDATLSYASDLSPGYEPIPVQGEGSGTWGSFDWGSITWGGSGTSRPFRTLIPVNKQRCRYINGSFEHNRAFEKYSIYGISYTYAPVSARAYR